MFRIHGIGDNLTQGLSSVRQCADSSSDGPAPHIMLTISIVFALLVALWGFSGTLVAYAQRALAGAKPRTRPAARPQPVAARSAASRTRGTRPVASA